MEQKSKNLELFKNLKKKYKVNFKENYFLFFLLLNRFLGKKKPLIIRKFKRISPNFLEHFNINSYLYANSDVADSKEINPLEHFILYGYDEVLNGKRRIGNEFPFFSEQEYLRLNQDIKKAVEAGDFNSGFEHFLSFGCQEFIEGKRKTGGHYPFRMSEGLEKLLKESFDEKGYLEANIDTGKDGFEHFIKNYSDIRDGKRKLKSGVPLFFEEDYVHKNKDVFKQLKNGNMDSPFEHFIRFGADEIAKGKRFIDREYFYKEPLFSEEISKEIEKFKVKPLISILMPVYNVEKKWLSLAIKSIKTQWYKNWELCIVDDASTKNETKEYLSSIKDTQIKLKFLPKNLNISGATNEALNLAGGDFIALMDNDDEITVDALYEVVKAINLNNAEFIYSDEDKLDLNNNFVEPHFKPDFAPDMLLSQNYLSHLSVIKKELIEKVGGWEVGLEGAQDYDLYLKVLEQTNKITHVSKVLYHWRKIEGSTASEFSEKSYAQQRGLKALESAIIRRGLDAKVVNGKNPGTYKIDYSLREKPLVSIIIPFKDKPELLDICINSILQKSIYNNYEIIGISNNSNEEKTFELIKELEKNKQVSFYEYNVPFNYSQINNYAVRNFAKGDHIILLNNDIEIISPNWIESMLVFSQREDIGVVGAKLYYPDNTIQHAGVIIGIGGVAGHSHKYFDKEEHGYFSRLDIIQNVSAVTGACLMVKKSLYIEFNGLNEKELTIAFNDVDFCLRLREKNYFNIYTPYAEAYHHESISRGSEDDPKKITRFNKEVHYMMDRHKDILKDGDPFYNKNLTLENEDFGIRDN